ncbi:GrpB family protein [Hymenobacter nivis]|uniref:GrpB family protein n=1 Tax=Hymenobacter nivis TaxID=1850093 RepID=UPI001376130B|nr:GrpB family protein [Hymenobacter nivis]
MSKELKSLTKEEWNTFFPVELVAHDAAWKDLFAQEKHRLLAAIGPETLLTVEHFGSTAIPAIKSKPYIDLLIAIPPERLFSEGLIRQFEALGYAYFKVPQRENIDAYMSFGKGYRVGGGSAQIYHLHVCPAGNAMWEQPAFRDYLNAHPARARQYERLKLGLAAQFRHDRGAYVLGKARFIADTLALARLPAAPPSFPVSASTLDAQALGHLVAERYALGASSTCRLLKTGINHTYLLADADRQYVLRVYSHNWRTRPEIEAELALLLQLRAKGLGVSYPLADRAQELIQEVAAPEGRRYLVLFSFAAGGKVRFLNPAACTAIGAMLGQLHQVTSGQPLARPAYTPDLLLTQSYASARTFFAEELPEMEYLRTTSRHLAQAFAQAGPAALPTGAVHLDFWYDNMAITEQNEITVFDFDFCGNGPAVLDVAYFCLQLFNIEADKQQYEDKVAHFLAGYGRVRSLSADERQLVPAAGAAVWLFYLGVQVQRFDWTNFFLSANYLKVYVGMMRAWLTYHKWPVPPEEPRDGPAPNE